VDKAETEPDAAIGVAGACGNSPPVPIVGCNSFTLAPTTSSARRRPHYPRLPKSMRRVRSACTASANSPGNTSPVPPARELVIRTCGLYGVWGTGGKGGNFVETMLRLAGEGRRLPVVNDQYCSPSYTADIAEANGLAHSAPGELDFPHTPMLARRRGTTLPRNSSARGVSADLTPISSAEFGRPANRPPYTAPFPTRKLASVGVPARARGATHWRRI